MPEQESDQKEFDPKQFDFMLKEEQKPKKKLIPNLPKPALLLLSLTVFLFVTIIGYSLLFGSSVSGTEKLVDIMARSQEIARVSTLASLGAKSLDTKALAVTTSSAMSGSQREISKYFVERKVKVDPKILLTRLDKQIDQKLQAASINNNYDQVYFDYLKSALQSYQTALVSTYTDVGQQAKAVLDTTNTSVETLLSAPQLK